MPAYVSHQHLIWRLLQKKCRVEQGRTHPGRQVARATKFLRICLIFMRPQYGTGFMSSTWRQGVCGGI